MNRRDLFKGIISTALGATVTVIPKVVIAEEKIRLVCEGILHILLNMKSQENRVNFLRSLCDEANESPDGFVRMALEEFTEHYVWRVE